MMFPEGALYYWAGITTLLVALYVHDRKQP